jgi:RecB family exonuclease
MEINYRKDKVVSFSQYQQWKNCPHQWYLNYGKGLKKFKPNMYLVFGNAIHETIQNYLTTMFEESATKADKFDNIKFFKDTLRDQYKKYVKKNKNSHFSDAGELHEFYNDGEAILDFFLKKRRLYFKSRNFELKGIELPLVSYPHPDYPTIKFSGFIDVVMYDKKNDHYTIIDIKTSTRGWGDKAKKDKTKAQQILLYKKYYSEQYKVPMENIDVSFFIVKRKIYENSDYPQKRIQEWSPVNSTFTNKTAGKNLIRGAVRDFQEFINECFTQEGIPLDKEHKKNVTPLCGWCPYNDKPDLCNKNLEVQPKFFTFN